MTLVDAHVHLRACFDVESFLNCARSNFEKAAERVGGSGELEGVLCLARTPSDRGDDQLLSAADHVPPGPQRSQGRLDCIETDEPSSVRFEWPHAEIVVVAGRQLESDEGLEVLAIGTRGSFESGQSLKELLQSVNRAGAIPVVPWGVGKWFGVRGRCLETAIRDPNLPPFFLGDSGNRPLFWPRPSLFRSAEDQGIRDLPGSDPLPVRDDVRRVGSVGVALEGSLSRNRPARDLKRKLRDETVVMRRFGSQETPFRFVRNQLLMQYRKWIDP